MIRNWYLNEQVFAQDTFNDDTDCYSIALICPICGVLWGREELVGRHWMPVSILCEAHGGGHLLTDFTLDCLADGHKWADYPPKVIGHEVSLLLKEKKDGRDSTAATPTNPFYDTDGSEGIT